MMIDKQINDLQKEITTHQADTHEKLQAFRDKFISKKGIIALLFAQLKNLPLEQKKRSGQLLNKLKDTAHQKYAQIQKELDRSSSSNYGASYQDITLPPVPNQAGTLHPLTHITQKIIAIFRRIGFSIDNKGGEIENDWYNFTALNFPKNHPARQMQDTFFIANPTKDKSLLRTHTSCVQVRTMQKTPPPIRVISTGKVFRKETLSARTHCMFHQLEGLYVNKNVNFVALKATVFFLYTAFLVQRPKYVFAHPTSLSQNLVQK